MAINKIKVEREHIDNGRFIMLFMENANLKASKQQFCNYNE